MHLHSTICILACVVDKYVESMATSRQHQRANIKNYIYLGAHCKFLVVYSHQSQKSTHFVRQQVGPPLANHSTSCTSSQFPGISEIPTYDMHLFTHQPLPNVQMYFSQCTLTLSEMLKIDLDVN